MINYNKAIPILFTFFILSIFNIFAQESPVEFIKHIDNVTFGKIKLLENETRILGYNKGTVVIYDLTTKNKITETTLPSKYSVMVTSENSEDVYFIVPESSNSAKIFYLKKMFNDYTLVEVTEVENYNLNPRLYSLDKNELLVASNTELNEKGSQIRSDLKFYTIIHYNEKFEVTTRATISRESKIEGGELTWTGFIDKLVYDKTNGIVFSLVENTRSTEYYRCFSRLVFKNSDITFSPQINYPFFGSGVHGRLYFTSDKTKIIIDSDDYNTLIYNVCLNKIHEGYPVEQYNSRSVKYFDKAETYIINQYSKLTLIEREGKTNYFNLKGGTHYDTFEDFCISKNGIIYASAIADNRGNSIGSLWFAKIDSKLVDEFKVENIDCFSKTQLTYGIKQSVKKEEVTTNSNQYKVVDMTFKGEEYPYRIRHFNDLIVVDNKILTSTYCFSTRTAYDSKKGHFDFTTDLINSKSTLTQISSNVQERTYGTEYGGSSSYSNNRTSNDNNFYSATSFKNNKYDAISMQKTTLKNGQLSSSYKLFNNQIEFSTNGNIETYESDNFAVGNGLILISYKSTYSSKYYLFIGNFDNDELIKVDLPSLHNGFKHQHSNNSVFSGYYNGKDYYSQWSSAFVFKFNDIITAFVSVKPKGENISTLIPVQVNTKTGEQKVIPISISYGDSYDLYNTRSEKKNQLFFLPESGGFVNTIDKTVHLYDNKLKIVGQFNLSDFSHINHITEKGNYLIIGGYTKTKGYLGYPNPIIHVIDKSTLKATYTKVIASKNNSIDCINVTNNMVVIAVSGFFGSEEELTSPDNSKIIIDELNSNGVFSNDLFQR